MQCKLAWNCDLRNSVDNTQIPQSPPDRYIKFVIISIIWLIKIYPCSVAVVVDGTEVIGTVVMDVDMAGPFGILSDFFLVLLFDGGEVSSLSSLTDVFMVLPWRDDKPILPRLDFFSLSKDL